MQEIMPTELSLKSQIPWVFCQYNGLPLLIISIFRLWEWLSLIWGFATPILDKQAAVMIRKFLKLEEQLFSNIFKSTVIWYYATYANTKTSKKTFKITLKNWFGRLFTWENTIQPVISRKQEPGRENCREK